MKPASPDHFIDAELVFDRFLGGDALDRLQELVTLLVPRWGTGLRVWRSRSDQRPIDLADPGALAGAVLGGAGERGETYRSLVAEHGVPEHDRFFGSVELRGAGPELVVVVAVDQMVVAPLGERSMLGNKIVVQVRKARVEGVPGLDWTRRAFEVLCAELAPAWAAARHPDEYWAKVMSDGPPIQAVGRDFGRALLGVFWLNWFGPPYVDLLGSDRLASLPGAVPVGAGVIVEVGPDPAGGPMPRRCELRRRSRRSSEASCSSATPTQNAWASCRLGAGG